VGRFQMAFAFAIVVGPIVVSKFAGGYSTRLIVVCVITAVLSLVLMELVSRRRIKRFARDYSGRLKMHANENTRLICISSPEEFQEFGELADVPFEPAIFRIGIALRSTSTKSRRTYVAVMAAALCAIVVLEWTFETEFFRFGISLEIALAFIAAELATAF